MEVISLKNIPRCDWASFVDNCDECWFFHHPEAQTVNDPAFQGFALCNAGKLQGLYILYARRILGTSILTYHAGAAALALDHNIQDNATYEMITNHLTSLAKKNHCSAIYSILSMCAPANMNKSFEDSHLAKLGFKEGLPWGDSLTPSLSYTSIINLTLPIQKIYKDFYKTSKTKCKRALRLNLRVELISRENNDREWQNFINNHLATFQRSGGTAFNHIMLDWLKHLVFMGFAQLINFYHHQQCVASLLLITYKKRASYFASGIQPSYYDLGLPAYMHWVAIQAFADQGYEWYELGQSYPQLAPCKLHHLGQFKRTFGGIKPTILAGTFITSPVRYSTGLLAPKFAKKMLRPLWRLSHGT